MTGIVSVSVTTSPDLAVIAAALKAGDKELNREMRKALRIEADKLVALEKAAVMGLSSKGTKGSNAAQANKAFAELRGKKKITDAKIGAALGRAGLRQSVSNSIGKIIRYQGNDVGIRVRAQASKMPPGMDGLPRMMNRGKWRHPFFGGKKFYGQTVSPPRFWDSTAREQRDEIIKSMESVLIDFERRLARKING
jgi:hypothetical protein